MMVMMVMNVIPSKFPEKQRILSPFLRRENRGIERSGKLSSGCTVRTRAAASGTKSSRSRPISSSPKLMLVRTAVLSPWFGTTSGGHVESQVNPSAFLVFSKECRPGEGSVWACN